MEGSLGTRLADHSMQFIYNAVASLLYLSHGSVFIQLRRKPLAASEFIAPLSKIEPIYAEEEEEFKVSTQ